MDNAKTFLEVVKNRKSIRSFLDASVDPSVVRSILELATYAPTNCNQQLWNFIVIEDFSTKERLVKEAASNTLVRRAPIIIIVTYDGWNKKEAVQGASLAVGHIVLAAEYYGVGALPMNSYGSDKKIKKILNIPKSELICCFVLLGYPDERARSTSLVPRRPAEETIHLGKFSPKRTPSFTYKPDDWRLEDLRNHQKYYCRKTFPGKEMEITSSWEREITRLATRDTEGPLVDLFSYDGSFLKELPDVSIKTVDLNFETAEYTKAAVLLTENLKHVSHHIYDENKNVLAGGEAKTITLLYKLERLPLSVQNRVFEQAYATLSDGGSFIIVARKYNFWLSLFFFVIKFLFGNDIRKTGIFAYFGPYKPIRLNSTLLRLKNAGFSRIRWAGYFLVPPFFEQAYQMFVQYVRSGGSSYLHRDVHNDFVSRLLTFVMKIQGLRRFGRLGSVVVITCKK